MSEASKLPEQIISRKTGSSVRFKCVDSGNPKPTITWFHNNEQISDLEPRKSRNFLVISDLKPEDSGNYTCVSTIQLATNTQTYVINSYILKVIGNHTLI